VIGSILPTHNHVHPPSAKIPSTSASRPSFLWMMRTVKLQDSAFADLRIGAGERPSGFSPSKFS